MVPDKERHLMLFVLFLLYTCRHTCTHMNGPMSKEPKRTTRSSTVLTPLSEVTVRKVIFHGWAFTCLYQAIFACSQFQMDISLSVAFALEARVVLSPSVSRGSNVWSSSLVSARNLLSSCLSLLFTANALLLNVSSRRWCLALVPLVPCPLSTNEAKDKVPAWL